MSKKGQSMATQLFLENRSEYPISNRLQLVESLAEFRKEWQEVAESESLINVQASVGLLLTDVLERLGFQPQEQHIVLGAKLYKEIKAILEAQAKQLQ
jgi:hypothetical protein